MEERIVFLPTNDNPFDDSPLDFDTLENVEAPDWDTLPLDLKQLILNYCSTMDYVSLSVSLPCQCLR